jgi:hypothetical protein
MARLSAEMKNIDLEEVETSLEQQDNARSHYSTDDLAREAVIEGGTVDIHSKDELREHAKNGDVKV